MAFYKPVHMHQHAGSIKAPTMYLYTVGDISVLTFYQLANQREVQRLVTPTCLVHMDANVNNSCHHGNKLKLSIRKHADDWKRNSADMLPDKM